MSITLDTLNTIVVDCGRMRLVVQPSQGRIHKVRNRFQMLIPLDSLGYILSTPSTKRRHVLLQRP